jgi:hypothetical protein
MLPDALISRCQRFGEETVRGYANGWNENSRAVSSHGAESNARLQAFARMGECGFCLWTGQDPETALNWSGYCDAGYDLLWRRARFDVKTIAVSKVYLIWPIRKNGIYDSKNFDILALVKVAPPICIMAGWISKSDFAKQHETAGRGHRLDEGTWYLSEARLNAFAGGIFDPGQRRFRPAEPSLLRRLVSEPFPTEQAKLFGDKP